MPYFDMKKQEGYKDGRRHKSESECKTLMMEILGQKNSLLVVFNLKLSGIFKERKEPNYTNLDHCHDDILIAFSGRESLD